ncbi:hypothetical protein Ciccas_013472 [Cichlidogyrus casuarinus]|uniref:Uncharacterized protein n=1 Tax=Cichlidogyrus casuarinus TaxID=1844966 RepID=A0ABD2PKH6_9PLAT
MWDVSSYGVYGYNSSLHSSDYMSDYGIGYESENEEFREIDRILLWYEREEVESLRNTCEKLNEILKIGNCTQQPAILRNLNATIDILRSEDLDTGYGIALQISSLVYINNYDMEEELHDCLKIALVDGFFAFIHCLPHDSTYGDYFAESVKAISFIGKNFREGTYFIPQLKRLVKLFARAQYSFGSALYYVLRKFKKQAMDMHLEWETQFWHSFLTRAVFSSRTGELNHSSISSTESV